MSALGAARAMLPLYVLLAAAGVADTIEMKATGSSGEGLKMEGTIERETDDFIILSAQENTAVIRIPRSKIKSIEYDIKTQLNRLEEDDMVGRFKVGLWAMDKSMYPEAIEVFEEIKDEDGVPVDIHKKLGEAYEQRQQLDKALESYSQYLLSRPDDVDVKEKVAALIKEVKPEPDPAQVTPGAPVVKKIVDGLEADGNWLAEKWDNPATVQFTTDATGNKMVVIQTRVGQKDKAYVSRTGAPLNLSDSKAMVFRVFHSSPQPITLAIGFNNSQGEFHETKQITRIMPEKWNNLSVRVDTKEFKAARNKFQSYDLALDGRERINQVVFLVYGQREVTLYIDSVFFKATDDAPEAPKDTAPPVAPKADPAKGAPVAPGVGKPTAPAAIKPAPVKAAPVAPAKPAAKPAAREARPAAAKAKNNRANDNDDLD